jgi:hypothetical protein
MIICKPKSNTYIALGSVLALLSIGLISTLFHFANANSFPMWFYLSSTSLLTVVIVMLLVKMMAGYKYISAGKEKITLQFPLRKSIKSYDIKDVQVWEEEKIMANKREFRQLTIVFTDQTSFSISNHEHENYLDLLNYLHKKLGKKNSIQLIKNSKLGTR